MAQALYDDRLNNIKTWPNYHTVNYAEQLEEDDNENRVSDHNYVICVKKPPDERVEKFYNGNIPDSLDNYIRRINASYFMTVDNLTKDIWADDSESIKPSETKSPPPYIPNTYAIRRIIKNSVWNNNPEPNKPDPNKYEFLARLLNLQNDTPHNWKVFPNNGYSYTGDSRLYAGRRYKLVFKVKDDLNVDSFTINNIAVYSRSNTGTNVSAGDIVSTSKTFNKGEETSLTYIPTFNDLRYLYLDGHAADFDYVEMYASYTDKEEVPSNSAIQTIIDTSIWNSVSTTRTDSNYFYHNVASSGAVQNLLISTIWSKDKFADRYDPVHNQRTWAVGDECLYNDTCYICTTAVTDQREAWTFTKWKEIGASNSAGYNLFVPNIRAIQNLIYDGSIWDKNLDNVTNYSSTRAYAVGDECIYDHKCYRCTTAITSGEAWNSSHWTNISFVYSKGSNLFVPTVGAIQDIIKSNLWTSYSDSNKVIPTIGAIKNIITSSSGTVSNPLILPDDNEHVPTNATVNNALNSVSSNLYSDGIIYYNSGTGFWNINSNYAQDNTHFITPSQMYYLGLNRWW